MKNILSIAGFMLLLVPRVQAQTFAWNAMPKEESIHTLSSFSAAPRLRRHRAGTLLVGGICTASLGCLLGIVGEFEIYDGNNQPYYPGPNQSEINTGYGIAGTGGIMIPIGIGMIIAGAIHDHRQNVRGRSHHDSKLGIVAPKRNELGVAYHF